MSWHADAELLARYAGGTVDDASAFSLEAHLVDCAACQRALAACSRPARLDEVWSRTLDVVDAPDAALPERALRRLGVRDDVARVMAATPALRRSWLLAVVAMLAFAVAASRTGGTGVLLFLTLAPLLPVGGVAAAYGPGVDPTYEIGVAAPTAGWRLLMLRSVAVAVTAIGLAGTAAAALPGLDWTAAAWLLPALGLTLTTLALATAVQVRAAAAVVASVWVAAVLAAENLTDVRLAAFRAPGQAAFAALAVVALVVLASRRQTFEMGREVA